MKNKDRLFYLGVLKSNGCQCGQPKAKRKALCITCYRRLPNQMQRDLYKPIGNGFEDAYETVVEYLN